MDGMGVIYKAKLDVGLTVSNVTMKLFGADIGYSYYRTK